MTAMFYNFLASLVCGLFVGGPFFCAQTPTEDATSLRILARLIETTFEDSDIGERSQFIPPSREALRPLISAARLIKTSKFSNAALQLGEILADQSQPDFLIPLSQSQAIGYRQAAHLLMELVPESALADYRLKYQIPAQQLLDRAVEELNHDLLALVSKRYFFTEAGVQASVILGHVEFSQGNLSEACMTFRRVVREANRCGRCDPEAQLMVAIAELLAGNKNASELHLRDLISKVARNELNAGDVHLLGEPVRIPTNPDEGLNWLTNYIGSSPIRSESVVRDWQMALGSPDRNGISTTGLPMLWPEWSVPLHVEPDQQEPFTLLLRKKFQDESKIIPAFFPIAVGNTVVFRSREQLVACELESGQMKWNFPPNLAWGTPQPIPNKNSERELRSLAKLSETVFSSWLTGDLTSDDQHLYSVPFSQSMSGVPGFLKRIPQELDAPIFDYVQVLRALELDRQGALKWQIGGASGMDDPRLKGTAFLGAPLAMGGKLYAVCKQNDMISVVAIDAASGRMEWILPLVMSPPTDDDDDYVLPNQLTIASSLTPSFRNGILICPCGTGTVVAISLDDKSFLWGYAEPKSGSSSIDPYDYPSRISDKSNDFYQINWIANRVVVDHAVAVFTQTGFRKLILIELATGQPLSAERINAFLNQQGGLYVAGIRNGKALCVSKKSISTADINTGELIWTVVFGSDEEPSGHGFYSREHYHLPLSSGRVIKISLRDGRITDEIRLAEPLGNLICHRGYVISQSPNRLSVMLQSEPMPDHFELSSQDSAQQTRLKLRMRAIVQSKQGDLDALIETLETIWKIDSNDTYIDYLKSAYLKKLAKMPAWTCATLETLQHSDEKFHRAVLVKRIEIYAARDLPTAIDVLREGLRGVSQEVLYATIPLSLIAKDDGQVVGSVRLDRWIGATIGRALKNESDRKFAVQELHKMPISSDARDQLIRAIQIEFQRQINLTARPHDLESVNRQIVLLNRDTERRWQALSEWGYPRLRSKYDSKSSASGSDAGNLDSSFVFKLIEADVAESETMEIRGMPDNGLAIFDQNLALVKRIELLSLAPPTATQRDSIVWDVRESDEEEDFYDDEEEALNAPISAGFGIRFTRGPWNLLLTEHNAHLIHCQKNDWQNARLLWSRSDVSFDILPLGNGKDFGRFEEDHASISFGLPAILTQEGDLVWLNGTQLEAIDIETGDVLWHSPGHPRTHLLGAQDEVAVFKVDSQALHRFEISTGLPRGNGAVVKGKLLEFFESHIVKIEELNGRKTLQAVNFKTNANSWTRDLAPSGIVVPIRDHLLGILTDDQSLEFLDMRSGRSLLTLEIEPHLPPRTRIHAMRITEVAGRLLVLLESRPPDPYIDIKHDETLLRVIPTGYGSGLNTGYLMMIDQTTGQFVWPQPLRFEAINWYPDSNSASPLLAGLRKIDLNNFPRSYDQVFTQFFFIDLRTGREVSRIESPSKDSFITKYQFDWANRIVNFSFGDQTYSFEFVSEALPPAPLANVTLRSTRLFRTPEILTAEESKPSPTGRRKVLERMEEAAAKDQEQRELMQKVFGGEKVP